MGDRASRYGRRELYGVFAVRLGERLGVDDVTAAQAYYVCLLFYVGCTADADIAAEIFHDDASVLTHVTR
jgi:hypothetical protein